jgi:two-component system cell cycle sensor histidine kinase/response regulator CckA
MTTPAWKSTSQTFSSPALKHSGVPGVRIANAAGALELVMSVDVDDFVRMLAERVLTSEGYRVVSARDGFEAMELLAKLGGRVDLVILDFVMPTMDGAQVLHALRKIVPNMPIVVASGFTENSALRELLAKGVCGFIPKPLARNKLLISVRSTIEEFRGTM